MNASHVFYDKCCIETKSFGDSDCLSNGRHFSLENSAYYVTGEQSSVHCNFKTGDWYLLDDLLGSGLHEVTKLPRKALNWADLSILLACEFFSFCRFFSFLFQSFKLLFISPCWVIEPPCSDANGWILVNRYSLQCSSPCSFRLYCLLGCGRKNDTQNYYMLNIINFLTGNFHPTVRRWACKPFGQSW